MRFVPTALIALMSLSLSAPAAAAEILISIADGPLRIAADGSVKHVDLRTSLELADEVALEKLVRRWRFRPMEEAGRAVPVDARVHLDLVAVVAADGSAKVGVQDALFFEGNKAPTPKDRGLALEPPRWPKNVRRSGALYMMWLGLDGTGRVRDVRLDDGWVTGEAAEPGNDRGAEAHQALLAAAKSVAQRWDFSVIVSGECALRVPIRFWLPVDGWQAAKPVAIEQRVDGVADCDLKIGADGDVVSRRIELLTPLRKPMPSPHETAKADDTAAAR